MFNQGLNVDALVAAAACPDRFGDFRGRSSLALANSEHSHA
jgi:hypothetical protein